MIHHRFVHVIALLVAIVLATSAAAAQAVGGSLVIQEGRTPRGVRYAFLPQPFENTVAVSFSWWDGFAQARPGQELVGRLAVAWLQAGTERLPEGQFWEELRDDQIGLRLETGNRITSGFFSGPPDKLSVAAERMREVLLTPALSDRSLARLQRRYASKSRPGARGARNARAVGADRTSRQRESFSPGGCGSLRQVPRRRRTARARKHRGVASRRSRSRHLGCGRCRACDGSSGHCRDRPRLRRPARAGEICRPLQLSPSSETPEPS